MAKYYRSEGKMGLKDLPKPLYGVQLTSYGDISLKILGSIAVVRPRWRGWGGVGGVDGVVSVA